MSASAKFGFVGIGLNGGGTLPGDKALDADLVLRLKEPAGSNDGNISLAELINNLDDLGSILDLSLLGGAKVGLDLTVTPAIPGLNLGSSPKVELEALNFGDIFGKYADLVPFTNTAVRTGSHSFTVPNNVTADFIRGSVIKVGRTRRSLTR